MMFENVPAEMRQCPQWIVWFIAQRDGMPTKVPLSARSGQVCAVNDQLAWATFDQAVAYFTQWQDRLGGIGFCFSDGDAFTGIDLDDPFDPKHNLDITVSHKIAAEHITLENAFDSYTEFSPSGRGKHIIVAGKIARDKTGTRYRCVEIYSRDRFFTVTGNAVQLNKPIAERQQLLDALLAEIETNRNAKAVTHDSCPETQTDDELYQSAGRAKDGALFYALWQGRWDTITDDRGVRRFPSQSEADLSLINIIGYYSRNHAQIARMFRASGLGQRDKARRDNYVLPMVARSQDMKAPPVDLEAIRAAALRLVQRQETPVAPAPAKSKPTPFARPAGLIGDLMDFVTRSSIRTTPEIAACVALGFMAGVCGHAYNVSGTGLNFYGIVVADTGTGKESLHGGLAAIAHALSDHSVQPNFAAVQHHIGPSDFASGQGIVRLLETKPVCVSAIGEIGFMLENFVDPRYTGPDLSKKRMLLLLYMRSGWKGDLGEISYSDKTNNTKQVRSPALTLLGETTPDKFNAILRPEVISDGLLPRFSIFEYTGPRMPPNEDHKNYQMSDMLRANLCAMLIFVSNYNRTFIVDPKLNTLPSVLHVELDDEATALAKEFDTFTTEQINASTFDAHKQLWNRAHLKALRFAALVAVGVNYARPIIDRNCWLWAQNIVSHEVNGILAKFESGKVGTQNDPVSIEMRQAVDTARTIMRYFELEGSRLAALGKEANFQKNGLVSVTYLRRYMHRTASFKNDRSPRDLTYKIDRALNALVAADALVIVPSNDAKFMTMFGANFKNNFYGLVSSLDMRKFIAEHE
jgi:hypothetical protein